MRSRNHISFGGHDYPYKVPFNPTV